MFERYTEQARSVIFWAREEAQKAGSEYIEPEHFLVGLLREDPALPPRFLSEGNDIDALLREAHDSIGTREAKGTNLDEPMSHPLKRVLAYGAEEAGRMHQRHIGTEHHLLGLLREPSKANLILEKYGVHLKAAAGNPGVFRIAHGGTCAKGRCRRRNLAPKYSGEGVVLIINPRRGRSDCN